MPTQSNTDGMVLPAIYTYTYKAEGKHVHMVANSVPAARTNGISTQESGSVACRISATLTTLTTLAGLHKQATLLLPARMSPQCLNVITGLRRPHSPNYTTAVHPSSRRQQGLLMPELRRRTRPRTAQNKFAQRRGFTPSEPVHCIRFANLLTVCATRVRPTGGGGTASESPDDGAPGEPGYLTAAFPWPDVDATDAPDDPGPQLGMACLNFSTVARTSPARTDVTGALSPLRTAAGLLGVCEPDAPCRSVVLLPVVPPCDGRARDGVLCLLYQPLR